MFRFRPRLSVRTLAIVVTLACAYFGAWEATKRYVEQQVGEDRLYTRDKAKLLLSSRDYDSAQRALGMLMKRDLVIIVSHTDLVS